MIAGVTGSLLSHEVVAGELPPHDEGMNEVSRKVRAWHARVWKEMGPAHGARSVFDRVAVPLLTALGFRVVSDIDRDDGCLHARLEANGRTVAVAVVTGWGHDPATAWRESVRLGIGNTVRWCLCITGPSVRVVDATRCYSRRYAQFDVDVVVQDPAALAALWTLLRADAFTAAAPAALDRAVAASEQFRTEVRRALQDGVLDALQALLGGFAAAGHGRKRREPAALVDESLIVIYRILFLLFAEARGLVPRWHPIFRESYTIESLRGAVERDSRPRGLWESLQAIARLAHDGCHAGSLRVPPFNSRLFSPAHAPLADSLSLDDRAVRQAMLALTTRGGARGRRRIAYADLGVEQLGGVYERILDYSPAAVAGQARGLTLVRAGRRKATGTFYTPRTLTEFVVRRTLAPLVAEAGPDRILALRVLDPAMGSGAFLVAACRYLAAAYETALIREGVMSSFDVTEPDRAGFRRTIAQRCLYGVDINPMAVQLGRLSLWLATLSADRPLTFLDHHLRAGNSLVGAAPEDVARQPPVRGGRHPRCRPLPLFEMDGLDRAMQSIVAPRLSLARDPGDTIGQVRAKERLLLSLHDEDGPLARWKTVADLWCAEWFRGGRRMTPAVFGALVDRVLGRDAALPDASVLPLLRDAHDAAARERFFHWHLEFPELFHESDGAPLSSPGFDAVIGNPPWEMLRGDRGECGDGGALTAFTRESGVYRCQGGGHANLYQLFTERALTLVKRGGRLGLILPAGFGTDHGCAALRRATLDRTSVDTFVTVENRDGVFPIHRGLKFLLLAATAGTQTLSVPSRAGVRSPDVLDRLPDGGDPDAVSISRTLIEQFSGDQHAIPELRTSADLRIVSRIAFALPRLMDERGWHVRFGRELNATEDREHFIAASGGTRECAVVEGKQIAPFHVDLRASRFAIREGDAARLVGDSITRARLAYRDVASPSNRLTLIAAVLPPRAVSTHTLFCLKSDVDLEVQHFLCGIFNSFVANYLVRLRVSTHVTVAIVESLPVPRPPRDAAAFSSIVSLSRRLSRNSWDAVAAARLQAIAAALYGCTDDEFRHVLESFPLVPRAERALAFAQLPEIRQSVPRVET